MLIFTEAWVSYKRRFLLVFSLAGCWRATLGMEHIRVSLRNAVHCFCRRCFPLRSLCRKGPWAVPRLPLCAHPLTLPMFAQRPRTHALANSLCQGHCHLLPTCWTPVHSSTHCVTALSSRKPSFFFNFNFNFFFYLWWILSYIEMKQPRVYMCSPSQSPPPTSLSTHSL